MCLIEYPSPMMTPEMFSIALVVEVTYLWG